MFKGEHIIQRSGGEIPQFDGIFLVLLEVTNLLSSNTQLDMSGLHYNLGWFFSEDQRNLLDNRVRDLTQIFNVSRSDLGLYQS